MHGDIIWAPQLRIFKLITLILQKSRVFLFMEETGLGSLFRGGNRVGQVLYLILKVLCFLGKKRREFSISEFSIKRMCKSPADCSLQARMTAGTPYSE